MGSEIDIGLFSLDTGTTKDALKATLAARVPGVPFQAGIKLFSYVKNLNGPFASGPQAAKVISPLMSLSTR